MQPESVGESVGDSMRYSVDFTQSIPAVKFKE